MGQKALEEEHYIKELIENSTKVDIQLNTTGLSSMLKAQFGNNHNGNTPKQHKRKITKEWVV